MDEEKKPIIKKKIRYDEIKKTLEEMSNQKFILEIVLEGEDEDANKKSFQT